MIKINVINHNLQEYKFVLFLIYSTCTFIKHHCNEKKIQSTLVISKSKGPSETPRGIRTLIYQMSRIEENTNRTTKFHK